MNASSESTPSDASRLAALLETKDFIPFHLDLPDKEYAYITLSVYGATKTNELFVKVTNGQLVFVEAVNSPLLSPGMADRIWGMDAADAHVAFSLADKLWEKHKHELVMK
ncbi:MAG TPA: hypothetical protein VGD88_07790 [Opitutaceae bacterium]